MATAPPRRSLLLLLPQLLLLRSLLAAATPSITTKAVPRLPGFSGPLPFSLETGYVELDDGVRLFYYFIQSERDPEEDPVLLWLTGGPGCSALSGLVYEIGPFYFDFEGYTGSGLPTLLYKPASWTQVSNVIFVDSPAGTGFSYDTTWNRTIPSDTIVIQQLHTFLQTWFDEHPQFLPNPFYVAGDSYSGIIIPPLAMKIAKTAHSGSNLGIEYGDERLINLKVLCPYKSSFIANKAGAGSLSIQGVIAGNPLTDLMLDFNSRVPFLHRMGIISDELYEAAREGCRGQYRSPSNADCANSLQAIDYNSTYFLSEVWINDEPVRESLGIHKGTVPSWLRCDFDIPYTKEITDAVDGHLALIAKGYRAMIYSGDHDASIPYVGTQAWIRKLNLPITDNWRPWYVDGQVVGFTRTYSNNLTYATVKGAGHTAPEYMPKECLAMIDRWLSGEPL
ncbi:serine carboxypeptidase-like 18 isoform X10 [Lolium rigidum]|uniref:serine carboxypeptidase-like 18 isoform X10 n=1 Tax=Lolium rigidum TaxID=89674 RepID=UPI001F5D7074|nr:serine carboxypeptidase-like 18 isoform X10 [Lolium rigidum]